jgi:hypothetical protein
MSHYILIVIIALTACGGLLYWVYDKKFSETHGNLTCEQAIIQIVQSTIDTVKADCNSLKENKNKMTLQIQYILAVIIAILVIMALFLIITLLKVRRMLKDLNKQEERCDHLEDEVNEIKWKNCSSEPNKANSKNAGAESEKRSQEEVKKQEATDQTISSNPNDGFVEIKDSKSIPKIKKEYLKAGRENESFFWAGSENDSAGSYFVVIYDPKKTGYEGKLNIIDGTDIANIKTINTSFYKKAIKVIESNLTLQEAKNYNQVTPGKVIFDEKDRVWKIVSPVVIKLFK